MCLLTETRALSAQGEKRALVGNLTMPSIVLLSACSATMPARLPTFTSQQAARKSSFGNGHVRCLCHADEIPKLALILTWAKSGSKLIDSRTMAFT